MNILAIDPGLGGALAWLNVEASTVEVFDMPTIEVTIAKKTRRRIDESALSTLVHSRFFDRVVIEKVGPMPTDSARGAFAFGETYGLIQGIVGRGAQRFDPTPQAWKKSAGLVKGATKDESRLLASKLFPKSADSFKRKKDDGRAEAALMAWCFRNVGEIACRKESVKGTTDGVAMLTMPMKYSAVPPTYDPSSGSWIPTKSEVEHADQVIMEGKPGYRIDTSSIPWKYGVSSWPK